MLAQVRAQVRVQELQAQALEQQAHTRTEWLGAAGSALGGEGMCGRTALYGGLGIEVCNETSEGMVIAEHNLIETACDSCSFTFDPSLTRTMTGIYPPSGSTVDSTLVKISFSDFVDSADAAVWFGPTECPVDVSLTEFVSLGCPACSNNSACVIDLATMATWPRHCHEG